LKIKDENREVKNIKIKDNNFFSFFKFGFIFKLYRKHFLPEGTTCNLQGALPNIYILPTLITGNNEIDLQLAERISHTLITCKTYRTVRENSTLNKAIHFTHSISLKVVCDNT